MAESIRLPGSMAFRSPCTSPNWLGVPGLAAKSSISLFRTKPAPVTVTLLPYQELMVVVTATAFPWASTMEKWVVCRPSASAPAGSGDSRSRNASTPGSTSVEGVAASSSTERRRKAP